MLIPCSRWISFTFNRLYCTHEHSERESSWPDVKLEYHKLLLATSLLRPSYSFVLFNHGAVFRCHDDHEQHSVVGYGVAYDWQDMLSYSPPLNSTLTSAAVSAIASSSLKPVTTYSDGTVLEGWVTQSHEKPSWVLVTHTGACSATSTHTFTHLNPEVWSSSEKATYTRRVPCHNTQTITRRDIASALCHSCNSEPTSTFTPSPADGSSPKLKTGTRTVYDLTTSVSRSTKAPQTTITKKTVVGTKTVSDLWLSRDNSRYSTWRQTKITSGLHLSAPSTAKPVTVIGTKTVTGLHQCQPATTKSGWVLSTLSDGAAEPPSGAIVSTCIHATRTGAGSATVWKSNGVQAQVDAVTQYVSPAPASTGNGGLETQYVRLATVVVPSSAGTSESTSTSSSQTTSVSSSTASSVRQSLSTGTCSSCHDSTTTTTKESVSTTTVVSSAHEGSTMVEVPTSTLSSETTTSSSSTLSEATSVASTTSTHAPVNVDAEHTQTPTVVSTTALATTNGATNFTMTISASKNATIQHSSSGSVANFTLTMSAPTKTSAESSTLSHDTEVPATPLSTSDISTTSSSSASSHVASGGSTIVPPNTSLAPFRNVTTSPSGAENPSSPETTSYGTSVGSTIAPPPTHGAPYLNSTSAPHGISGPGSVTGTGVVPYPTVSAPYGNSTSISHRVASTGSATGTGIVPYPAASAPYKNSTTSSHSKPTSSGHCSHNGDKHCSRKHTSAHPTTSCTVPYSPIWRPTTFTPPVAVITGSYASTVVITVAPACSSKSPCPYQTPTPSTSTWFSTTHCSITPVITYCPPSYITSTNPVIQTFTDHDCRSCQATPSTYVSSTTSYETYTIPATSSWYYSAPPAISGMTTAEPTTTRYTTSTLWGTSTQQTTVNGEIVYSTYSTPVVTTTYAIETPGYAPVYTSAYSPSAYSWSASSTPAYSPPVKSAYSTEGIYSYSYSYAPSSSSSSAPYTSYGPASASSSSSYPWAAISASTSQAPAPYSPSLDSGATASIASEAPEAPPASPSPAVGAAAGKPLMALGFLIIPAAVAFML